MRRPAARISWLPLAVLIGALLGAAPGASGGVRPAAAQVVIPTGGEPIGIAWGDGSAWVSDQAAGTVIRIASRTNTVTARIPVGGRPFDVEFGDGAVWVGNETRTVVTRIDPRTNKVVARIPVGNRPLGLAYARGSLWVANETDGTVMRIDAARNAVSKTIRVGGQPENLAIAGQTVWVTNREYRVDRIDARTGIKGRPLAISDDGHYAALAGSSLWVTSYRGSFLWRFSATSGKLIARIRIARGSMGIAVQDGKAWVANWDRNVVTPVSVETNTALPPVAIGVHPHDVTAGGGSIWIAENSGSVLRISR